MSKLVGCINSMEYFGEIKTRFIYISEEEIKDVSDELCAAINDFNKVQKTSSENQRLTAIPYAFKDGLAVYSHGCGLSHYLQNHSFKDIEEASKKELSFPLSDCSLYILTPDDIKNLLDCKDAWDLTIKDKLYSHFY